MSRISRVAVGVSLSLSLLGAGCTDSSSSSAAAKKKTAASTTTLPKVAPSTKLTIAAIIGVDSQFATLLDYAKKSLVIDELAKAGPYTLLAPDVDAFSKLDKATLASFDADPAGKAAPVLRLNILKGSLRYEDLIKAASQSKTVSTIDGASLKVTNDGGTITIGGVHVIKTDIVAENGIVQVVDGVVTKADG